MPNQETRYVVRRGDSLGQIAARFGISVTELVDRNIARYPSLRTRPGYVEVGWTLDIPESATNETILFVGMNPNANVEVAALRQTGARVVAIGDSAEGADCIRVDGIVHDLSTDGGARAFVQTMGLEAEQSDAIAKALVEAFPDARDELGQIAQVWSAAELGSNIPARLLLSGHSVGNGVWGDDNGTLTLDSLGDLALAMPKAARAIEDVHVSGCYSGGRYVMNRIQSIFPAVKTIWAYAGSAPGAESGATVHEVMWEKATRGDVLEIDRNALGATRKGKNVAIWRLASGYDDGGPLRPIEGLRFDYDYFEPVYDLFRTGEMIVTNPQSGELRDYYNILQELLAHPDLMPSDRPELEARRDRTIRLLYYSVVAPKFAEFHAETIRMGYSSVGLSAPNYATLSRKDAVDAIERFSARARMPDATELARRVADLLEKGLRDLDPSLIPDGWV